MTTGRQQLFCYYHSSGMSTKRSASLENPQRRQQQKAELGPRLDASESIRGK